ncbi:MAG: ribonuclease HI [Candidatus Taylorbacteria bacterium]|nr:ribonuclease HI [Candidatus Taylorbacteria bacterium]
MKKNIVIFTDGSSRGNPGPGGWGAVIVESLKSKVKSIETVRELGGREDHTTNNRMELSGTIKALEYVADPSQIKIQSDGARIVINTDSAYVVNGITKWVYGWQKNGWKTAQDDEVLNKDLWQELFELVKPASAKASLNQVKWNLIPGHSGIPGNERCDEIATAFADLPEKILPDGKSQIFRALDKKSNASGKTLTGESINLFNGKLSDYEVDITDFKGDGIKKKSKSNSKVPAYSYLSLVHGIFKKHKDWASCEKEVKGIKGNIKFKKTFSEEDEREVKRSWGVK